MDEVIELQCEDIGRVGIDARGVVFAVTGVDFEGGFRPDESPDVVLLLSDIRGLNGAIEHRCGSLVHRTWLRAPATWPLVDMK
jgi:hypothetical protein